MLKKALVVARWEFIATVTKRTYMFAVIAMPVFYGGMFALAGFTGRSALTQASQVPTAIVDKARIVDIAFASELRAQRGRPEGDVPSPFDFASRSKAGAAANVPRPASLVAFDDEEAAFGALRARRVGTVFLLEPDYLRTGTITAYSRESSFFTQQADRQRQVQVVDAIRASLLRPALTSDALARAYTPVTAVKRFRLDKQGRAEAVTDLTALGPFAGAMGVFLLFTMAIFFSAGFLQQATVVDRQNRMIEILLSSLDSNELLVGKILGLGGAGLLQLGIYLVLIILPGAMVMSFFEVPLAKLALSVVYFVIGYLLFACLMAGTGVIARSGQEAAQVSFLWTLASASPLFFLTNIATTPNGTIARALSFVPLTSPVTMMLRLASTDVPPLDIVISVVIGSVAIVLALRGASRVFRASALMYGQRPTLPQFARWLRAA